VDVEMLLFLKNGHRGGSRRPDLSQTPRNGLVFFPEIKIWFEIFCCPPPLEIYRKDTISTIEVKRIFSPFSEDFSFPMTA
jgi:hypothetical protein